MKRFLVIACTLALCLTLPSIQEDDKGLAPNVLSKQTRQSTAMIAVRSGDSAVQLNTNDGNAYLGRSRAYAIQGEANLADMGRNKAQKRQPALPWPLLTAK